jgi:hypothetical protein
MDYPFGGTITGWRDNKSLTTKMRADVAFGSLADIPQRNRDVRYSPKSGHGPGSRRCPIAVN